MDFSLPPNPNVFFHQVWQVARQVPHGRVATYGQIARLVPLLGGIEPDDYRVYGSRWVGKALAACPADVPWQRVINAQGKISQRPGAGKQRLLLEQEGVLFTSDKIDLKLYQWRDPSQKDVPRQGRLF